MKQRLLLKIMRSLALLVPTLWPLAALGSPSARQGDDLTLERAIRMAMENSPTLRASGARKLGAAGRAVQARAWPNPELEVSSQDMPTSRSRVSQAKHMVGISQMIPYPGKKTADAQIGQADLAAGAADWRSTRADLVRDVKISYAQVKTAEASAAVAEDLVAVAQAAAAAAGKRSAAGEITLQEQLRAEIQLEQTQADKLDAQREATLARQAFALLLGRPDLRDFRLSDALEESADLSLTRITPSAWLAGHPSMVAARARRDQAVATLRRAGLEPLPDVKVGVAGGRDEAAEENLMELRFSLALPIFDRNTGKELEAKAAVLEADAAIAAAEQYLLADWRTAAARYQIAARQVTAHRNHILPKSQEALRLVQTGFDEGKFGFIDLLDIQRTTAEVRMTYQKKLLELNTARADLEAMAKPAPNFLAAPDN